MVIFFVSYVLSSTASKLVRVFLEALEAISKVLGTLEMLSWFNNDGSFGV